MSLSSDPRNRQQALQILHTLEGRIEHMSPAAVAQLIDGTPADLYMSVVIALQCIEAVPTAAGATSVDDVTAAAQIKAEADERAIREVAADLYRVVREAVGLIGDVAVADPFGPVAMALQTLDEARVQAAPILAAARLLEETAENEEGV